MEKVLPNKSTIIISKSKFFIYRALGYFSFLLIPVWIQKSLNLNQALQCLVMVLYVLFMISQWFMLGKEIDHRLKIYFRVNSSIDRVVYRLLLGMVCIIIYFNLLSLLPAKWTNNLFWTTWAFLGLFYSWPTRGKIILESVSTNFSEFRYLDSFEKTLVGFIVIMFVFSVPELPMLTDMEALKLFFDPNQKFNVQFWNFITVNYFPFIKYPTLFKLGWCMHFYVAGMGIFLLTLYALLRFIISRRLALLGVFALITSWSFSKILASDYGSSLFSTYSLLWIWSLIWITKSSTYRTGLFMGLIGYLGAIINQSYALLVIIQITLLYHFFLKNKTRWFRRQLIKYASFGIILTVLTFFSYPEIFENLRPLNHDLLMDVLSLIKRKAFYSLSFFGLIIILVIYIRPSLNITKNIHFDMERLTQFFIACLILVAFSFFFDACLVRSFSMMWFVTFLSLIPLELIFQIICRLRSSRNLIYLTYIIICLLDSHFEGRVKIFLKLFN